MRVKKDILSVEKRNILYPGDSRWDFKSGNFDDTFGHKSYTQLIVHVHQSMYKSKVILLCISIALQCLKRRIAELPLRAGLIHAL